jgi:hypothetical protein
VTDKTPVDAAQLLRNTKTGILINYLPLGSQQATEYYTKHMHRSKSCVPELYPSLYRFGSGMGKESHRNWVAINWR